MTTERDHEKWEAENAKWQDEFDTFMEVFGNPDFDHWGRMEFWDFDEAVLLSLNIKPPSEVVINKELWKDIPRLSQLAIFSYKNTYNKADFDKRYTEEFVRPLFSHEIDLREQLIERASEIKAGKYRQIHPVKFIEWADKRGLNLPVEMVENVRKYSKESAEIPVEMSNEKKIQEPLSGEERRELGMLKQQKERWEKAIEATVEAVLIAHKKKVTRDELAQHLHGFDLPFTTLEVIWKSLREKGFTKGPGRPAKEKEKNP